MTAEILPPKSVRNSPVCALDDIETTPSKAHRAFLPIIFVFGGNDPSQATHRSSALPTYLGRDPRCPTVVVASTYRHGHWRFPSPLAFSNCWSPRADHRAYRTVPFSRNLVGGPCFPCDQGLCMLLYISGGTPYHTARSDIMRALAQGAVRDTVGRLLCLIITSTSGVAKSPY